jgi:hypothetical protein
VRFACLFAFLILDQRANAEDVKLNSLRATLLSLRKQVNQHGETRGATPQLTVAKHQLRDWIESRLPPLKHEHDEVIAASQLNEALREANLFCSDSPDRGEDQCSGETELGYLDEVKLKFSEFLIVQTAVGIDCGYDESAYIYQRSGDHWVRRWQSEQNTYTEMVYVPQTLHAVLISPAGINDSRVVLTLGSQPWCSSNWRSVYYRLWRMTPDAPESKPLLEQTKAAYLGAHDPPIQGSVGADDVLIEYTVGSIDVTIHNREAIRHYSVEQDNVKRLDPVALSPRDFVDEWLTHSWPESSTWSEQTSGSRLRESHRSLHSDSVRGEFTGPTLHCSQHPDLWQVGIDFNKDGVPAIAHYFLVRWRPPYRFTMVQISDRPSPGCTEENSEADSHRELFPVQEWR